jgi:hypothetical protein
MMSQTQQGWLYGLGNPVNSTDFGDCVYILELSFKKSHYPTICYKRYCGRELITNEIYSGCQERALNALSEQLCAQKIGHFAVV